MKDFSKLFTIYTSFNFNNRIYSFTWYNFNLTISK